ncbi:MAG: 50S ribosomal protein L18 [Alphaproteobacteria bacterium]|nr:50S ribosomal protein L18 [Alphaproteobacteria bacterium]MBO7641674.1 50S ribosomal protein L18 [Alphaproteobacteria bacterium]
MARFSKNFKRRAARARFAIRRKAFGKPRLSVFRSDRHMYAQIIDDSCGKTLCSASTLEKNFRADKSSNCDAAAKVGTLIASKAVEAGIKEVVFDRGGYNYHGRVKALADGARSGGLVF